MSTAVWLGLGFAATVLWGASYAMLRAAGTVSPYVTNTLVGSLLVLSGLCGELIVAGGDPDKFRAAWALLAAEAAQGAPSVRGLYVAGYVVTGVAGGYCYLSASLMPGYSIAILTAMTSVYPLVTTAAVFALFGEWRRVQLALAIPGMALAALSCVLLALSPIPSSSG
jgi:hypothetical protein